MDSRINGQAEALQLLRKLRELNFDREHPRRSANVVAEQLRAVPSWTRREQRRFLRVISDFLVFGVMGWGTEVDEYQDALTFGKAAVQAQRQRAYEDRTAELAGKPVSVTH